MRHHTDSGLQQQFAAGDDAVLSAHTYGAVEGVLIGNNPLSGVGPSVQANSQVRVVMTPDGDIDCNGLVNIADVTALINRLLSGTAGSLIDDVNGDGVVNISDVTALINQLLNRP